MMYDSHNFSFTLDEEYHIIYRQQDKEGKERQSNG